MKVLLFANTDWYLYNFRRSLAHALRASGHQVLLISPPGEYGEQLRKLGYEWIAAPMERRSLNPWRELQLLRWLRRVMRDEQVDVVHGFTIKCAVYGSLAARLAGVPGRIGAIAGMGYVFTSDDVKARMLRPVLKALFRLAFGGDGTRLIVQNPTDFAYFESAGLARRAQIRLIPGSGVDCTRFSPKESHEGPKSPAFRVVLPARLLWDKGVAEFVDAARILRAENRNIEFVLAGTPDDGNPTAVPETALREWVDEGLVIWLGHVSNMPVLFQQADAVVLPSYREGLPKGLIEAAASGLPLVTTDVPGCRDVVSDGVNGLLVPPRDAGSLARAIARLHDDAALCTRLGSAAREKALREFDERLVLERTLKVYDEVRQVPGSLGASSEATNSPRQ